MSNFDTKLYSHLRVILINAAKITCFIKLVSAIFIFIHATFSAKINRARIYVKNVPFQRKSSSKIVFLMLEFLRLILEIFF